MKLTAFTNLMVLALLMTVAASGCRKRPGTITPLPGHVGTTVPESNPNPPLTSNNNNPTSEPLGNQPESNPDLRKNWPRDAEIFKSDTVHFAFDSSEVPDDEKSKISAVADYLKAHPETAVEIDGHCDERGTEEYNRSLGERRALALRAQLISLGIAPDKVDTVSYGKDRPVDPGHNEAAWKQNRRGEFLLETPPK